MKKMYSKNNIATGFRWLVFSALLSCSIISWGEIAARHVGKPTLVGSDTTKIDYTDSINWMCHPFLKKIDIARSQNLNVYIINKSGDTISTDTYIPPSDTAVDIFYIYPTIDMNYITMDNAKIDEDTIREKAQFIYREQAGIYARFGRVYAPYYRQANIGVFIMNDSTDSLKRVQVNHMLFAYKDVEAAFDNYLKNYNKGRKIILIGHSQGADHMRFLLRKKFDNNPALLSHLVVAISGGEPSYVVRGSRTGGSLQHIRTLKSDSTLESGCMISWRSWKYEKRNISAGLDTVSFFKNQCFVDSGLIYQTANAALHEDLNYDFGYPSDTMKLKLKPITRYIALGPDNKTYWGFDDMFTAQYVSKEEIGNSYLFIDSIPNPNDKRKIPNKDPNDVLFPAIPIPDSIHVSWSIKASLNVNYHCWDMQFVQGDLLKLIPQLIAITHPVTSVPKVPDFWNATLVYPNLTNGTVHLNNDGQTIKNVKMYNPQGKLIKEFFSNNFSISNIASGTYYIVTQTSKSTFTNKLIKK